MASNISCFTAGCDNPVVGQCSGYEASCGRFYCHSHSTGTLCGECAARKAHEDMLQDYLKTAQEIEMAGKLGASKGWIIAFVIFGWIAAGLDPRVAVVIFTVTLLGPVVLIVYALNKHKNAEMEVLELDKTKRGFATFCYAWKQACDSERRAELAGTLLGLAAAGVGGAVKGVGEGIRIEQEGARRGQIKADLTGIQNTLNDMNKKL